MSRVSTPIWDFVKAYAEDKKTRAHMPGHKGEGELGFEKYDITEFSGADSLLNPEGIIAESEKNASELFGCRTLYSTEGSSHCIRAMVWLSVKLAAGKGVRPVIAAGRNAHSTLLNAAAVLGAEIVWIAPDEDESYLSCRVTAEKLERIFASSKVKPTAVYITSPDYLGNVTDIASLAPVCKKYGAILAVDNAHGAYLKFHPETVFPVDAGADICCDSAHKTLPVITGGAYLHISPSAPEVLKNEARFALNLFGTTSPSYLILSSLDAANAYVADGFGEKLLALSEKIAEMKKRLSALGYVFCGNEPTKITVDAKAYGYRGDGLGAILEEKGVICEFFDPDFVVMMLSCENGDEDLTKIEEVLREIPKREKINALSPKFSPPKKAMEPKAAMMGEGKLLPVEECIGRVLASTRVGCPPAVPIVVCGEIIDSSAVECFKYYGITHCMVL
ncbi:MAG: aminotransferase class V-fold PLP-dependent enzyme [Oscillospiraceae bacterium]|nr:aminotransferase class V-fold PLP-dependent enzyme [Oscillospiraceae bacterium]